jgi:hypothetical protein
MLARVYFMGVLSAFSVSSSSAGLLVKYESLWLFFRIERSKLEKFAFPPLSSINPPAPARRVFNRDCAPAKQYDRSFASQPSDKGVGPWRNPS